MVLMGRVRQWCDIMLPSKIISKHKSNSDVIGFQKMQGVVQKMQGQGLLQLCYVSQAGGQRTRRIRGIEAHDMISARACRS
jgi:hypothetical protein